MRPTFLTGITGLVGYNVARELLSAGRPVRALVRDLDRARVLTAALDYSELELACGDVTDAASVQRTMSGCGRVFHCAGIPEQWLANPDRFRQVNLEGTRNLIEAALEFGVERFLHTSSIDVFGARAGETYDETMLDPVRKGTYYERSKQDSDRLVTAACSQRRLPAVILHPSSVYGPGPMTSRSLNGFLLDVRNNKLPGLPRGGMPVVFAPDCARGHLLAEGCEPGSRFILSDQYFTMQHIAQVVLDASGGGKPPMTLPYWIAKPVSVWGEGASKIRKNPPLIPAGQLHYMRWRAYPSSQLAQSELGWTITPFAEGVAETLRVQLE